ncbi:hypothetical protein BMMGA3_08250 [Bacillus methanolicus MGA3]|uniref:Uncharacterized protein n=2 Tax=Bacillus methanolicus TaxID=1471 RepID=A0A068LQM1_BACMM|nr:hypothetical protein BMMGA3_08250 [Bacillus methanolicus MGA3]
MMREKEENYLTHAPNNREFTIQTDGVFPNMKNIPGDSVDVYQDLKEANTIVAGKEIGQQNENL